MPPTMPELIHPTEQGAFTHIHPLTSSATWGWAGLQADYHRDMPERLDGFGLPGITHHLLSVHLDTPRNEAEVAWDGRRRKGLSGTGDIHLVPAQRPAFWRWRGPVHEGLHVFLDPALLARTVEAEWDRDPARVDLVANLLFTDPTLLRFSLALRDELLGGGPGGRLLGEGVSAAMAVHLLRRHSTLSPRSLPEPHKGGLTPRQLRRVLECMDAHLAKDVPLVRLAAAAGASVSHFGPAFRRTVGEPPHRHLMRLRVERAQALLLRGDLSLIQVAVACGFADQAHMTRAFRRFLGTTPGRWRRERLS